MARRGKAGLVLASSDLTDAEAIRKLKDDPAVEYAEPNFTYTWQATSNDPYVTQGHVWGLYGDLSSPANIYGSQAAEAWAAGYTGSNSVFVAIIDDGVQVDHPELAPNIWANPFDPVDGVDNDGNGYVDDFNGWNFFAENSELFEADNAHGTHVAGTIGAKGGNGAGVAGVNWDVTMIPAKFMSDGFGSTLDAVEAIDYCIDLKSRHGINLVAINASWGGTNYSRSLHDAVIRAAKAGILFVAAAGNSATDNDTLDHYPANIDTTVGTPTETAAGFNGVITVAAIDKNGALGDFSNYGDEHVHLGAPGVSIYSTYPGNTYAGFNGTSMAAPHVAGAIALYASTHPDASAEEMRSAIIDAVIPTPSLIGKTITGGRLNLSTIITPLAPPEPPATPTGFAVVYAGAGSAEASWTLSGEPTVAGYKIHYAPQGGVTQTVDAGLTNQITLTGLTQGSTWDFSVSAYNSIGGESSPSPVASLFIPHVITLSWTASDAPGVAGYNVYFGPAGNLEKLDVGNATAHQFTVDSLPITFRVAAYNALNVEIDFYETVETSSDAVSLDPIAPGGSAVLHAVDSTTGSFWKGHYGAEGYTLYGDSTNLPPWADISFTSANLFTWTTSTTNLGPLERADSTTRFAACWFSATTFDVDVNLTDGNAHLVSMYFLDYMGGGERAQRIDVFDRDSGILLGTTNIANYRVGRYLTWKLSGAIRFRITSTGRHNAVLSGIFVDSANAPTEVVFAGSDISTRGDWKGRYGTEGFKLITDVTSLPEWALIPSDGQREFIWRSSIEDLSSLERANSTEHFAACWYSVSNFTARVNLTDNSPHQVTLYLVDKFSGGSRAQTIEVLDAATGDVLDSVNLSHFSTGIYLSWKVTGAVDFRITTTTPYTAVLSGIFLDAADEGTAEYVGANTTTSGNWKGAYGSQGYNVIGDSVNLPSDVSITPLGASSFTWTASTTDQVVLERATSTEHFASCWFSGTEFSVQVNVGAQPRKVSLYCVDYKGGNQRAERIDVLDSTTGALLDSVDISVFGQGVYLSWNVTGSVKFRFTRTGTYNAVVSGFFIDPPAVP